MYGMEKTTVYLPKELKRALAEESRRRGVSEAELIRLGIAAITAPGQQPRPTVPLFSSGQPGLARNIDEPLRGFGER
jgi:hypothetical protein